MAIKVSSTDVVTRSARSTRHHFSGFDPNDDHTARFVTVTLDGKAANEVSVILRGLRGGGLRSQRFPRVQRAVGAIVPIVARSVAAPGSARVDGRRSSPRLDAALTNPRSFETTSLGFR